MESRTRLFCRIFASISNIFNQEYKTGGFEQGRNANYQTLSNDMSNDTRVFGLNIGMAGAIII